MSAFMIGVPLKSLTLYEIRGYKMAATVGGTNGTGTQENGVEAGNIMVNRETQN